ncbi:MAG: YcjX family protein [Geminicoccaceae bacterium]
MFAVSKADHVAPNQHPALKHLLELMIQPAARAPRFQGITVDVMTLAALRCTDVVRTEHQGQVLSCVRGFLKADRRQTVLFPGEIPPELPRARRLDQRPVPLSRVRAAPPAALGLGQHIRLDQALQFLIGDKFV